MRTQPCVRNQKRVFYPLVERWLKKHFACFKTAASKGLRHGRIDITGVRDVGGHLSGAIETIGIEVKRGSFPFANACGQTLGYNVYVNRAYWADVREEGFTRDEMHIASHLGIGLIQIRRGMCMEVLFTPFYIPIEKLNLLLCRVTCASPKSSSRFRASRHTRESRACSCA